MDKSDAEKLLQASRDAEKAAGGNPKERPVTEEITFEKALALLIASKGDSSITHVFSVLRDPKDTRKILAITAAETLPS